jgi:Kef-type K+ transport system membrane component KefB
MGAEQAVPTLVLIAVAAVLAPIVAELLQPWVPIPEVVIQLAFGIVLGPAVLNLAHPNDVVNALSDFGLTFLMFLAGSELDLKRLREGQIRLAIAGWCLSLALALLLGGLLVSTGVVLDRVVIALCLTTTALTTLLPILRDAGVIGTPFGRTFLSVGAVGEFGPIVAVALFLTTKNSVVTFALLLVFVVVAAAAALLAARVHPPKWVALLRRHMHDSAQLPVRVSVLLVVLLVYLTIQLGLDVLLGAFAAGIVVRLVIADEDREPVLGKLEAIGFGFLIPIFFIVSGISFDFKALEHDATALLRIPLFFVSLLVIRGLPAMLLYRRALTPREQRAMALFSATGLPLIVVITTIGVDEGKMLPINAASLVAAGMLSVLVYPLLGLRTLGTRRTRVRGPRGAPDPAG